MGQTGRSHGGKRVRLNERRIAIKHDGIAIKTRQRVARLCDRMGGAQLLGLKRNHCIRVMGLRGLGHGLGPVARDDDSMGRFQRGPRFHRMHQHRRTRDLVKHLG